MSLPQRALTFAARAHEGQTRDLGNGETEPYDNHCQRVQASVALLCDDPEVQAAAALHDVLEDTDVTTVEIRGTFGARVATLVLSLTDQRREHRSEGRRVREGVARGEGGACAVAAWKGDGAMKWTPVTDSMPTEADGFGMYRRVLWSTWSEGYFLECVCEPYDEVFRQPHTHWCAIQPPTPEPTGPTVDIRIAVTVDANGRYGIDRYMALTADLVAPHQVYVFTGTVAIPQPAEPVEVRAEVSDE